MLMLCIVIILYCIKSIFAHRQKLQQHNIRLINLYLHNKLVSMLLSLLNDRQSNHQALGMVIEKIKEYLRLEYILVLEYMNYNNEDAIESRIANCVVTEVLDGEIVYWNDISIHDNTQAIIMNYLNVHYKQIINKISICNDVIENFRYHNHSITLYITKVDEKQNKLFLFVKFNDPVLTHDEIELLFNQIKTILMLGSFGNIVK